MSIFWGLIYNIIEFKNNKKHPKKIGPFLDPVFVKNKNKNFQKITLSN